MSQCAWAFVLPSARVPASILLQGSFLSQTLFSPSFLQPLCLQITWYCIPGAPVPCKPLGMAPRGAAWLHVVLIDLLGGTNLMAVVRRGVSHHTFLHLSPGTPYELTFSVAAGPH